MVPLPLLVIYSISILSSSSRADTQLFLQKSTFWSSGVLGEGDSIPSSEVHSEQSNPIWWLVICLCHQTKPSQRDIKGSWLRQFLEEVFHKKRCKGRKGSFSAFGLCAGLGPSSCVIGASFWAKGRHAKMSKQNLGGMSGLLITIPRTVYLETSCDKTMHFPHLFLLRHWVGSSKPAEKASMKYLV